MKICIIGNSHISALKRAVDKRPDTQLNFTFFGSEAAGLKGLKKDKEKLIATSEKLGRQLRKTSGGLAEIELKQYDIFFLSGCQIKLDYALGLFRTHRPFLFHDEASHVISDAAFRAAVRDSYRRSTAVHVLKLLAPLKKIVLIPAPLRNELIIGKPKYSFLQDPTNQREIIAWLSSVCSELWNEVAREYQAEVLIQHPQTIGAYGLTKEVYARERSRGNDGQWLNEPDDVHTSSEFGELQLQMIEAYIQHLTDAPSTPSIIKSTA